MSPGAKLLLRSLIMMYGSGKLTGDDRGITSRLATRGPT